MTRKAPIQPTATAARESGPPSQSPFLITIFDDPAMKPERIQTDLTLDKTFAKRGPALDYCRLLTAEFFAQASRFGGRLSIHTTVAGVRGGFKAVVRMTGSARLIARFRQALEGQRS